MTEPVIRVDNITKSFRIYYDKSTNLKEKALFAKRNRYEEHDVLKGISFEVMPGEAIGIIGANGCGKSTLLKMLSRIMYPDSGTIEMKGRVSALIELGAGFHPDMSGRENIYTNAAIFGLSRKEIDERLQRIIDFSELGEFIDNPVRTYSSGMYMRLAFSVAINVDADILLVDEILAVGDAAFQAKCFNRMREIKASGTTIVIVSHSLGQIEQICDRTYWIRDGFIEMMGSPRDVHPAYLDYMGRLSSTAAESRTDEPEKEQKGEPEEKQTCDAGKRPYSADRWGSGDAVITGIRLLDVNGEVCDVFATEENLNIEIGYEVRGSVQNPVVGIGIFRNDGLQCYGTNTQIEHVDLSLKEKGTIVCSLREVMLLPGEYSLDVAIHNEAGFAYDYWRYADHFRIFSEIPDIGAVRIRHEWSEK